MSRDEMSAHDTGIDGSDDSVIFVQGRRKEGSEIPVLKSICGDRCMDCESNSRKDWVMQGTTRLKSFDVKLHAQTLRPRSCPLPNDLSFCVATLLLRWNAYTFIYRLNILVYDTHNFLLGLLGYLILIVTQAFVPQRQFLDRRLSSPLSVFLVLSNFISTPKILPSYIKL